MSRSKQNVTMIDDLDLIDLDDIPSSVGGGSKSDYNRKMAQENQDRENILNGPIRNKVRNNVDFKRSVNGGRPEMPYPQENYQLGPRATAPPPHIEYPPIEYYTVPFTCVDVANHISICPICSKIYTEDKTPYLITIALLAIIVVILLKKFFERIKLD
jgi:hypothetical protein